MYQKSVLNAEISCFKDYYTSIPETVNLRDWLRDETYKDKVERIRKIENKTERDKIKATLPAVTISGLFKARSKAGLIKHSSLICVDIDRKDNLHIANFEDLKQILSAAPFVAYCALSISGTGYYAIVPILHPEKHEMHFEALRELFKVKLGINIDLSCKDVSRLRGYSWDERPYVNCNASPFRHVKEVLKNEGHVLQRIKCNSRKENQVDVIVEKYISEIIKHRLDIAPLYHDWINVGFALAEEFGEDGRQYFHEVSQFYPMYDYIEADKKYTNLLKNENSKVKIATFFHYCRKAGIVI